MNVSENIIRNIRRFYRSAFLQGITLRYEPINGLDVSIDLSEDISLVGLQFKKPKRAHGGVYEFEINSNKKHDQHWKLLGGSLLSKILPHTLATMYAFPTFYDIREVAANSPQFIARTYFIDPMEMPPDILDNQSHIVEIDTINNIVHVRSKLHKVDNFFKGKDFIKHIIKKNKFKKIEEIKDILKEKQLDYRSFYELRSSILNKKWNLKIQGFILKGKRTKSIKDNLES